MNTNFPDSIQNIFFKDTIWGLLYHERDDVLIVDTRNEAQKETNQWVLDLTSLQREKMNVEIHWMERWIGSTENFMYSIRYKDPADPSNYQLRKFDLENKLWVEVKEVPTLETTIVEPQLYDLDSAYHKTVSQFLALELVVPCEYLELDHKIIISYYLRSKNGFDRFLLLIEEGEKRWKIKQDSDMRGFAGGAFFVVRNKLVFVKDRNEVCIHSF